MKKIFTLVILSATLAVSRAGFLDQLTTAASNQTAAPSAAVAALSQDQVVQGLKEALSQGVQNAISGLGHDGGFLTNLNVKIPLPGKLRSVETGLRAIHQEKLADDFIATMNRAAEQAVPAAASVFGDAIQQMSISDAKTILTGATNAATEFFRKHTQAALTAKFLPIVKVATDKAGVTAAYKKMLGAVGNIGGTSTVSSFLGGTGLVKPEDFDVDAYVTNQALNGLFKMVADEELRIRSNPVARTTDLLQTVFGSVAR